MRIALLADIHGNLAALEAVMVELERLQPDYVVVNGDLINATPHSAEVIDVVRDQDWVVVRGNHEFYYLDFGTPRAVAGSDDLTRWGQLHWLVERITPAQGAYLGMLPDERTLFIPGTQPVGIAHGVPGRNRVGFYNEQDETAIATKLTRVSVPTFVSAHSHVQVDRHVALPLVAGTAPTSDPHDQEVGDRVGNGAGRPVQAWHVINPGSVGLPLNGDTTAQFALIESVPEAEVAGGWRATHLRVAYDRQPTLDAFATTGMAEAGGVTTTLFYWELVTAEAEILYFFRWAKAHGINPDADMMSAFRAYCEHTGRDAYVQARDPLYQHQVT
jgi:predicted phosphodiesterase